MGCLHQHPWRSLSAGSTSLLTAVPKLVSFEEASYYGVNYTGSAEGK
jgi:hypothetical protein